MAVAKITRRRLLVTAAGLTAITGGAGLWLGIDRLLDKRFRNAVDRGNAFAPNVYVSVAPDSTTTIWLVRSEMGQGVSTALPMIVAEEMDADWSKVRVEHASVGGAYDYGWQFTASSASVVSMWTELRRAGAVARAMLTAAAATLWNVSASDCTTNEGRVLHGGSGRSASYGELAELARSERAPLRPKLKDPSEFRLIGKPLPRLDLQEKVTGKAVFGLDVQHKGQVFAAIARPPTWGGSADGFDDSAARAIHGVRKVVKLQRGVAVVADNTHAAFKGRDALKIRWKPGPNENLDSEKVLEALRHALQRPGKADRDDGDASGALEGAAKPIEATFEFPYLAHAAMEPMNCTARVDAGRCEIWAPTQHPDGARDLAANKLGIAPENVTVHKTYLGGGFGRRTTLDEVAEAVELASKVDAPVQLVWTREDDMRHGHCREASLHRLRAMLTSEGKPRVWYHKLATASPTATLHDDAGIAAMGARDMPYDIEHVRVEWSPAALAVPTTIWRSVGHSYNVFAVECFVDELAARAKQSPLDFRLLLLAGNPRLSACLKRVTKMANFSAAVSGGVKLGLATCSAFGSFVAQVARVKLRDGRPRVDKVWCAADCGTIVNPDTVRAQLEGGIVFGLTAALHGQLSIESGRIVQSNFHDYPLLTMAETPAIEVELIPSGQPPGGVGELGVPPVAPAVANALFAATGKRLRKLPFDLS